MNTQSAIALARWIAKEEPDLFHALYLQSGAKLGDFSDFFSSLGDGLSTAVSNVGSYLTSSDGLSTLAKLGSTYLTTQAQQSALQTQAQIAALNKPLAPIQTVYNPATGQYQAVVSQQTSQGYVQQPLTPTVIQQLTSGLPTWWPYAAAGAGVLVLFLMLRK